jgi:cyclophilin family peptidyl-prolyl cis-trans isomerase
LRKLPHPVNLDQRPELFEALENRLALYTSPLLANLPDVADMESAQNTVVRMRTSAGTIDIELYDQAGPDGASAAPITTANFLNYIRSGRYEDTFFHRLISGFVLQGGGFRFTPPATSTAITTDPTIQNEFDPGRSNIERTIAMAKLGNDPNSATSQFFFNLGDNASNLNNQNGGFTVFGRVIAGWDVVTTIGGFETRDLDQFFTGTNAPGGGLYDDVPVSGPNNADVVTIVDIEVLKPGGQTEFYTSAVYYPDGYRSHRIISAVELVNQDVNAEISYEIIARYETGMRDRVIRVGTLEPGAHFTLPISRGGDPLDSVRFYAPFAFEIRATGPVGATLRHQDFGATAAEAFIDPMHFTADQLRSWTFADGLKGPGLPAFLVWESLSGEAATLTVTFHYGEAGQSITINQTLQPFRRGGLDLNQVTGLPAGTFSVQVSSTEPIVAALSQYRAAPSRASTEMGMVEGGALYGVMPGAMIPGDGQSLISLYYPGSIPASTTVSISFVLADGTILDGGQQTLGVGERRRDLDISVLNGALPRDTPFTIRYTTSGGRVAAGYTSITAGDTVRASFQSHSTERIVFAGGFTSAANAGQEIISLYNPFSASGSEVAYRLIFHFVSSAGDEILYPVSGQGTLGPNSRVDIRVADLSDVLARINSSGEFRRYSITVESSVEGTPSAVSGAIFGQLSRLGMNGETVVFGPTLAGTTPAVALTDPRFL